MLEIIINKETFFIRKYLVWKGIVFTEQQDFIFLEERFSNLSKEN